MKPTRSLSLSNVSLFEKYDYLDGFKMIIRILESNFKNQLLEIQSKKNNDEIMLTMFERKFTEEQDLCFPYQKQLFEIKKKN